jgi:HTH-like domain
VSDNQAEFPIATMCRLLGVSPSGYYAWTQRQPSRHAQTDAALVEEIRAAHEASRGIYGAPRIHVDLAAKSVRVGRKRVAWLMSAAGIAVVSRRKFVTTTVKGSDRQAQQPPWTPEYQAIWEASMADQTAGGQGGDTRVTCISNGMPRLMTVIRPIEFVTLPKITYIVYENRAASGNRASAETLAPVAVPATTRLPPQI